MSALEAIAPALTGYFLCKVLRDVSPNLTAHNVVYRGKRYAVAADQNRVILSVSVGIARQYIEHEYIQQTHHINRGHVLSRQLKNVSKRWTRDPGVIRFVFGGRRLS